LVFIYFIYKKLNSQALTLFFVLNRFYSRGTTRNESVKKSVKKRNEEERLSKKEERLVKKIAYDWIKTADQAINRIPFPNPNPNPWRRLTISTLNSLTFYSFLTNHIPKDGK
jgi:hypothetical protein